MATSIRAETWSFRSRLSANWRVKRACKNGRRRRAMAELRLEQVSKHYIEDRHSVYALKDISLTIEQGEFVFLIGSSGAGKTTLLKLMSGERSS